MVNGPFSPLGALANPFGNQQIPSPHGGGQVVDPGALWGTWDLVFPNGGTSEFSLDMQRYAFLRADGTGQWGSWTFAVAADGVPTICVTKIGEYPASPGTSPQNQSGAGTEYWSIESFSGDLIRLKTCYGTRRSAISLAALGAHIQQVANNLYLNGLVDGGCAALKSGQMQPTLLPLGQAQIGTQDLRTIALYAASVLHLTDAIDQQLNANLNGFALPPAQFSPPMDVMGDLRRQVECGRGRLNAFGDAIARLGGLVPTAKGLLSLGATRPNATLDARFADYRKAAGIVVQMIQNANETAQKILGTALVSQQDITVSMLRINQDWQQAFAASNANVASYLGG